MTRYTDIDKLIAEYDRVHVGPAGDARKLMVEAPIADVAPRAEVEKILSEIEEYLTKERNEAKDFDAREKIKGKRHRFYEGATFYLEAAVVFFADLKKKYTEEMK